MLLLEVCEHLCKMLAIAEAMSSEGKWHLAQYYVLKEMLKDLRTMASEWCDQCTTCASTTSEEKMELEENSGDEVGHSFWQWGLKDMVAWWKGWGQKVEKADQELREMVEAGKKELQERMAGAQVASVGPPVGGHSSVGKPAGQVETSLSRSFLNTRPRTWWKVRGSTPGWWSSSTTPTGWFHPPQ